MQRLPPWYAGVIEFSYAFHSIFDLLFIVFGLLIVAAVSRPQWRHHLRWAVPAAIGSILDGLNRLVMDVYHYFGVGVRLNVYLTADVFNYLATALSFYSVFMLWRTLRDLALRPASPDPLAQSPPGVWPPAPVIK